MYFVILRKYTHKIMIPLIIAKRGIRYTHIAPFAITNVKIIEVKAPATPKMLYLLEANIAANIVAQIQVIIHWIGVPPLATASEIDRGIFIIATVRPAFQFQRIFSL